MTECYCCFSEYSWCWLLVHLICSLWALVSFVRLKQQITRAVEEFGDFEVFLLGLCLHACARDSAKHDS